MAEFDLASVLAGSVSNLNTGREAIEYIDRENIHADPGNFYSMEGIDQLAANIELCGLMDPIRVRPDGDGYVIVSGHRRFAAMTMLAKDGNEAYRQIPCIVDSSHQSAAMQELRLIYANASTRQLTSAELGRQAERVERLLYELKEQGVEFPGRMRDHVAEACQVSKSKIARLSAIRKNLAEEWREAYQSGELNETAAYQLQQFPQETQTWIYEIWTTNQQEMRYMSDFRAREIAEDIQEAGERACPSGGFCDHCDEALTYKWRKGYSDYECRGNCCACPDDKMVRCKTCCPRLKAKQDKLKAKRSEERRAEKEAEQTAHDEKCEKIEHYWLRMGEALERKKIDLDKLEAKAGKVRPWDVTEKHAADLLDGRDSAKSNDHLPLGGYVSLETVERLSGIADALGVSLDYLFCRTNNPKINK